MHCLFGELYDSAIRQLVAFLFFISPIIFYLIVIIIGNLHDILFHLFDHLCFLELILSSEGNFAINQENDYFFYIYY